MNTRLFSYNYSRESSLISFVFIVIHSHDEQSSRSLNSLSAATAHYMDQRVGKARAQV